MKKTIGDEWDMYLPIGNAEASGGAGEWVMK